MLHQDLNFADAHAICSLISQTKWRVYLTCILSCRIPGPRAETATKTNRLSIYMYNPRVHIIIVMRINYSSQSHTVLVFMPIRKGAAQPSSRAMGLSPLRRRQYAYSFGPIVTRYWMLDGSLLYVYIFGGGPFDTACAQARMILRCKNENRMSWLQFVSGLIGSVLSKA